MTEKNEDIKKKNGEELREKENDVRDLIGHEPEKGFSEEFEEEVVEEGENFKEEDNLDNITNKENTAENFNNNNNFTNNDYNNNNSNKDNNSLNSENPEDPGKEDSSKKEFKEKADKNATKMIFWIIGFLIVVIALLLIFNPLNAPNEVFKFNNLTFEKVKEGDVLFYSTNLNIDRNGDFLVYNLNLRNDPRILDKIEGSLSDRISSNVYVSLAPGIDQCPDSLLAVWGLGQFLGALGSTAQGAVTDPSMLTLDLGNSSNLTNESGNESVAYPVKTCKDTKFGNVIIIETQKDKTRIYEDEVYPRCIHLEVKGCEVVKGTEKLMWEILERFLGS